MQNFTVSSGLEGFMGSGWSV